MLGPNEALQCEFYRLRDSHRYCWQIDIDSGYNLESFSPRAVPASQDNATSASPLQ